MEKKLVLNVQTRTKEEKLNHLRREKMIPGVVYWKKQDPISLKFDYSEFLKLHRIVWESKIFNLTLDWNNIEVLVYNVKYNPINWEFQHIDFYAVVKGQRLVTKIPLVFVWNAKATMDWAIIEEQIKEIEVKVLPKDLIDSIEVDITPLENIWDSIRISDLQIDKEKFEILENPDDIVVIAGEPADDTIQEDISVEGVEWGEWEVWTEKDKEEA